MRRRLISRAAWDAKREQYPFHRTTRGIKSSPPPEAVEPAAFGDFVRVPIPPLDVVFWGFLTEDAGALFDRRFARQ
ncbi:hypothetical protein KIKIMORA_00770 [Brevundimonas phage vB_BpoS-Kikimora]|uniref:Uncharacterized protein n=1 Tax=Brevundimonas phage vB_BpoS-Kikimora TaxID=2948601 RepID=A0A9E7MRT8_9CAUD|nr:hypothetical protein KIKIMORA_00770 [Brevundimonas phage vB_BpoS-Kikimora]